MKLLSFITLAFLAAAGAARLSKAALPQPPKAPIALKNSSIIRCAPDRQQMELWLKETDIPLMPGAGKYQWKINTTSDSAQLYFNQGINMYYGFHIIESLASFKKAVGFDGEAPMIW